jgi:hypothetical protein
MHVLPGNNIIKTPQQQWVLTTLFPGSGCYIAMGSQQHGSGYHKQSQAKQIKHTSMVPATMYFMGFTTLHCKSHIGSINSMGNSVTCAASPVAHSSLLSATGQS